MSGPWILVLDEGTTSTRAMLFDAAGRPGGVAQQPLTQHYPRPGWVEHDPHEILEKTIACAREVIERAGGAGHIAAIGITNQRETTVAWDRTTGKAIGPALVWQDRRTGDFCTSLKDAGHEDDVQKQTGLLLDPYFSASKMRWLLDNIPEAHGLGDRLAFGTIDSWLIWHLTGGLHVSDATNASRTSLMRLDGRGWDAGLCDLFGIPAKALPEIVSSAGRIGETMPEWFGAPIPITGIAGDQQAATIGQGCLAPGETKATFGTGAFILTNLGHAVPKSGHRLLGTVLHEIDDRRTYALEGSIFAAGSAVKWLRDSLGLLQTAAESETLARSVDDSGGVVFVPALAGLGAPHWRPDAAAALMGMSFATTRAHIARAALESMAHQCNDLKRAFKADGADWRLLRIDGGMSSNNWLAQDLADILDVPLERPTDVETTARGAAMLAAVGIGMHSSLEDAKAMLPPVDAFTPNTSPKVREARLAKWEAGLAAVLKGQGE
ncbi:glycerol kinase GlpK [Gimibacter soli]|uniref:ATP:glycerol 3-phosphotransferase n=1 Tax=Gimibacter soli TaxID=3024400 RepID=A0AAF0BLD3_9PROT|nr:glycerol kinase GlpK [Gimibacter soli]WCL53310.1 glycerol kinase GlpK [Gimibacter soli]